MSCYTVIAAALTFVMGQRFLQTQKIMPAALVAGIRYLSFFFFVSKDLDFQGLSWTFCLYCSALMTCFYVYKIATGGNHIPPKAEWLVLYTPVVDEAPPLLK